MHTKLPWSFDKYGDMVAHGARGGDCLETVQVNGVGIAGHETAKANAALIVKAVNNHEALVEALCAALEWIDAVPEDTVLPVMPGMDRESVDWLLECVKS